MRHRKSGRYLGRNASHRLAMRRNLARNLFIYKRIRTTPEKAKETIPLVDKLITLAKESNSLSNFRRALALLNDKPVTRMLFKEIGPRFRNRQGGYTRIVRLSSVNNRLGDNAPQVIFELVEEEPSTTQGESSSSKKRTLGERIRERVEGGAPEEKPQPSSLSKEEPPSTPTPSTAQENPKPDAPSPGTGAAGTSSASGT